MIKLELSGYIEHDWQDNHPKILLVQESGLKIDLIQRLSEINKSFKYPQAQLNYWISEKRISKNQMIEAFLHKLVGGITAEYTSQDYNYSSWTHGTDYFSTLEIGGHNLFKELQEQEDKFIILEINYKD